ncbi:MAG: 3-hydroxyacyl-CoA dehydrogenase, partial [Deltaproteobacteria bacterium]
MGDIKVIGVIGAGIMGSGIAQVAATSGCQVVVSDVSEEINARARETVAKSLTRLSEKGRLSESPGNILERISWHTELESFQDVDYLIEAVPEQMKIKQEVFRNLDSICPGHTIFASNTSQFSITALAASTKRPDRFIGTHWFNPPVIMKLIEVVRGLETSDETLSTTLSLCEMFGKETVVCQKDSPGFITSRMISLWITEALRIVEEGIATIEDVDKACRLAFNHPMGPFE